MVREIDSRARNPIHEPKGEHRTNNQTFAADQATMGGIEGSLVWDTSAPTAGNNVQAVVGDTDSSGNYQAVALAAFGKDGKCYTILQSNDPVNSFTGYQVTSQSATHTCASPTVPSIATGSPAVVSGSASKGVGSGSYYTSW
jgi:hypothetical protein